MPEDAVIKCGRFTQDGRGRWYVSVVFDSNLLHQEKGEAIVGIDPGIKTLATISDGTKIERPNLRAKFLEKNATTGTHAQVRAKKTSQNETVRTPSEGKTRSESRGKSRERP